MTKIQKSRLEWAVETLSELKKVDDDPSVSFALDCLFAVLVGEDELFSDLRLLTLERERERRKGNACFA